MTNAMIEAALARSDWFVLFEDSWYDLALEDNERFKVILFEINIEDSDLKILDYLSDRLSTNVKLTAWSHLYEIKKPPSHFKTTRNTIIKIHFKGAITNQSIAKLIKVYNGLINLFFNFKTNGVQSKILVKVTSVSHTEN